MAVVMIWLVSPKKGDRLTEERGITGEGKVAEIILEDLHAPGFHPAIVVEFARSPLAGNAVGTIVEKTGQEEKVRMVQLTGWRSKPSIQPRTE
jgi:hypothetical protein